LTLEIRHSLFLIRHFGSDFDHFSVLQGTRQRYVKELPMKPSILGKAYSVRTYTTTDGYLCHYRDYPPTGTPRARIVFIHGIQSHAGWYEYSCRRLSEAGFAVSFVDRRGSGGNAVARGDAPSFRRLLDDLAEFLRARREEDGSLPLFLAGISWGGKPVVALQSRHPGLVDGLILLCPGFCPQVGPRRRERLAIIWARLTNPRRLFPIPLNDPQLFTATPRWQEFIRTDPLSLRQATARFLIESVRMDGYLRWAARHVHVPVLTLLAEHDRIIDNERTRAFIARFPAVDKEVVEYQGAHHTLEFEADPDVFLADLQGWLDRQIQARTKAQQQIVDNPSNPT
jgi:alpha-beta hydrolase superfamily lysophospholipase